MRDFSEDHYLYMADRNTPEEGELEHIGIRLGPEEIIRRAESSSEDWAKWALFWLAIGLMVGSAITLVCTYIFHGGRNG